MYVCMYVYNTHTHTHAHTHARTHTHTHMDTHMRLDAHRYDGAEVGGTDHVATMDPGWYQVCLRIYIYMYTSYMVVSGVLPAGERERVSTDLFLSSYTSSLYVPTHPLHVYTHIHAHTCAHRSASGRRTRARFY